MSDAFLKIQLAYVRELYAQLPDDLDRFLRATREGDVFHFKAFGQACSITPNGIILGGERLTGPMGVLLALYARPACRDEVLLEPPKAFAQMKGSLPY